MTRRNKALEKVQQTNQASKKPKFGQKSQKGKAIYKIINSLRKKQFETGLNHSSFF